MLLGVRSLAGDTATDCAAVLRNGVFTAVEAGVCPADWPELRPPCAAAPLLPGVETGPVGVLILDMLSLDDVPRFEVRTLFEPVVTGRAVAASVPLAAGLLVPCGRRLSRLRGCIATLHSWVNTAVAI